MKSGAKIAIAIALGAGVALTFALRGGERPDGPAAPPQPSPAAASSVASTVEAVASARSGEAALARPRLLEVGSMRCQACLEMAKVLEALRASQGPRLRVDFIDVFEQPDAGDTYRIQVIPTQILYDASGKEIFRHVGYFAHDDILAKFRELGVAL